MKKIIVSLLLIGCTSLSVHAAVEDPPLFIRGIRPLGMGGAFTALADDQNAPFYNPAGLTQRKGYLLTVFELPVSVSQDMLDFYDFWDTNKDDLEKFDNLTAARQAELIRKINNDISKLSNRFVISPQINYMSGPGLFNWGAGLYSNINTAVRLRMDMITPALDIALYGDAALLIPFAMGWHDLSIPYFPGRSFTLPGKLSVGANYKGIYRTAIVENRYDVTLLDSYEPLPQIGKGWELDVASLYEMSPAWAFGLMISDITRNKLTYAYASELQTADDGVTTSLVEKQAYTASIRCRVNAGVAFRPQRLYYWPGRSVKTGNRLVLLADLRDILDSEDKLFEETFWAKTHLGFEYALMIFKFRGGLNQGYPTIGIGANLLGMDMGYAYYTDELGKFAGQKGESNHMVSLAFRFGGGSGRSRELADIGATAAPVKQVQKVQPIEKVQEQQQQASPEVQESEAQKAAPEQKTEE